MLTKQIVVGVDAGGTKTVAMAASASGPTLQAIGEGNAGSGNIRSVGAAFATEQISSAIQQALVAANADTSCLAKICIGAAGAGRVEERQHLELWVRQAYPNCDVLIANDAEILLAASGAISEGIALICGTGSLAWGRNQRGAKHRCGGWGYRIGDEGSAYAIALTGLTAAARAVDGRGPQTTLLNQFIVRLSSTTTTSVQDPSSTLVSFVYAEQTSRTQIAQLAECVFLSAAAGDNVAIGILADAAKQLALMIRTVTTQLSLGPGFALAMGGGVITHQHDFRRLVLSQIDDLQPEVTVVADPVQGAVRLAFELP